jgi:hypothetical protein
MGELEELRAEAERLRREQVGYILGLHRVDDACQGMLCHLYPDGVAMGERYKDALLCLGDVQHIADAANRVNGTELGRYVDALLAWHRAYAGAGDATEPPPSGLDEARPWLTLHAIMGVCMGLALVDVQKHSLTELAVVYANAIQEIMRLVALGGNRGGNAVANEYEEFLAWRAERASGGTDGRL